MHHGVHHQQQVLALGASYHAECIRSRMQNKLGMAQGGRMLNKLGSDRCWGATGAGAEAPQRSGGRWRWEGVQISRRVVEGRWEGEPYFSLVRGDPRVPRPRATRSHQIPPGATRGLIPPIPDIPHPQTRNTARPCQGVQGEQTV